MLQHLNHYKKRVKTDSFVTNSTDEHEVHKEVKLYLSKKSVNSILHSAKLRTHEATLDTVILTSHPLCGLFSGFKTKLEMHP